MPYAANGQISQSPIEGGIPISDEQYQEALAGVLMGKVVSIDGGFSVDFPPEPEPEPEPEITPEEELARWRKQAVVTRRQGKQALLLNNLLSQIQPVIDSVSSPQEREIIQIYWDDAFIFERDNPTLIFLGHSLGLSDIEIDSLFQEAQAL